MNVESVIQSLIILNRDPGLPPRKSIAEGKKKVAEKLGVSVRTINRYITAGSEKRALKGEMLEKAIKVYKKEFRMPTYEKKAFNEDEFQKVLDKSKTSKQYKSLLKTVKTNFINKDLINVIKIPYLNKRQFTYMMGKYYINDKMQALRSYKAYDDQNAPGGQNYVSKSFNFTDSIRQKEENITQLEEFFQYTGEGENLKDSFIELQTMEMF